MSALTTPNFWPTARHFAEAVQCPAVCFAAPTLRPMLPAVDRLGMPLVTSGQFAYVFKLNAADGQAGESSSSSVAVRCFRGYLGDREMRYRALDAHLNAPRRGVIPALPRFKYLSQGILVAGRRYPVLVMEWIEGPTLDVYLEEVVSKREVVLHLAGEWLRLVAALRGAGVAHGDLQHGNIIVERGQLRLVDLDGMYVPALAGYRASEVGHQHYQHTARQARHFSPEVDNFSALSIYLSLIALAERPSLWTEHHDENLIFTKSDFVAPESSALFAKIKELGSEHARLAEVLEAAARDADPLTAPALTELVSVPKSKLPAWMTAPPAVAVKERTREVARAAAVPAASQRPSPPKRERSTPTTPTSGSVQTLFSASASSVAGAATSPVLTNPYDVAGNTWLYARHYAKQARVESWVWIVVLQFVIRLFVDTSWVVVSLLLLALLLPAVGVLGYSLIRALGDAEAASNGNWLPGSFNSLFTANQPPPLSPRAAGRPPLSARVQPPAPAAMVAPVVASRTLSIYHRPDCEWADRIASHYRESFPSPAAALTAGYRPCHVCAP
ncbi:MAG: Ada metal-binding domain-containing protein [Pyrinomonadaceae bacterium]